LSAISKFAEQQFFILKLRIVISNANEKMGIKDVFESVYKFRDTSEENIDALKNFYLWFSLPSGFEDQEEGNYLLKNELSDKDLIIFSKKALIEDGCLPHIAESLILHKMIAHDFFSFIRSSIENLHIDFSIYSQTMSHLSTVGKLVTRPDVNMAANDFMWKEYGGNLTGYCIEFCSEKLFDSLKRNNPRSKIVFGKIDYTDDVPERLLSERIDDLLIEYVKHYYRKMNKFIDEYECRFSSSSSGKHFYDADCIRNVYFGSEMSISMRKKLEEIIEINYPKASVYILERGESVYHLHKKQ